MLTLPIFEFEDLGDYLKAVTRAKFGASRAKASLPRWAKQLGYRSPRGIGMVLSGARLPSSGMSLRLSKFFEHTIEERHYFERLIELERLRRRSAATDEILRELKQLRPVSVDRTVLDENKFYYVSDWYHYVIKQLVETPNFRPDAATIARRLRGKITPKKVEEALHRMVYLRILEKAPEPRRFRAAKQVATLRDIPSLALKKHHLQMLKRASEALREQPVQNREISSITLRFDRARTREAKEYLDRFLDQFDQKFSAAEGTDVFQLNLQFFAHTTD